ncbi:hypothetical protein [Candidatus Thiothrix anitrata]|uniref:Uncharacterized protein n=1 Tax=Candidatus Thiothrix anitrata TaxID=2823902 RepID=A0ABX7X8M2_9GAMM|nr:hypothetical protein [Candidatus Thiothrix anitrata]QTR51574.1 hypothetical protein J8380_08555 [Candidatus Thiothrix anitrata]
MDINDNGTQDTGTQQRNTYITMGKRSKQGWLDAALPLLWGAIAATAVVLVSQVFFKPATTPAVKLATADIAKIMQEFNERVLRDPNNPNAVNYALEESARAANQLDPLMKHLVTEIHPGYTLIQPQALAYHSDTIPDFTDELRVLLLKRTGKFNKLEDVPVPAMPTADQATNPVPLTAPQAVPATPDTPLLPLNPVKDSDAGTDPQ